MPCLDFLGYMLDHLEMTLLPCLTGGLVASNMTNHFLKNFACMHSSLIGYISIPCRIRWYARVVDHNLAFLNIILQELPGRSVMVPCTLPLNWESRTESFGEDSLDPRKFKFPEVFYQRTEAGRKISLMACRKGFIPMKIWNNGATGKVIPNAIFP